MGSIMRRADWVVGGWGRSVGVCGGVVGSNIGGRRRYCARERHTRKKTSVQLSRHTTSLPCERLYQVFRGVRSRDTSLSLSLSLPLSSFRSYLLISFHFYFLYLHFLYFPFIMFVLLTSFSHSHSALFPLSFSLPFFVHILTYFI
jgi:hypothetical protein